MRVDQEPIPASATTDPSTGKCMHSGYVQVARQRVEVQVNDQQLLRAYGQLGVEADRH